MSDAVPEASFTRCQRCGEDCKAKPLPPHPDVWEDARGELTFHGGPLTGYMACNFSLTLCPKCCLFFWLECRRRLLGVFITPFTDPRNKPRIEVLRHFYELSAIEMQSVIAKTPGAPRKMVKILSEVFYHLGSPEEVKAWLHSPLKVLGNATPCGAILDGDVDRVCEVLEQVAEGSYG